MSDDITNKKERIMNAIKVILEGMNYFVEVTVEKETVENNAGQSCPCAFIYSGEEQVADVGATVGYETWDWEVVLEVWADDTNMEQLMADVHKTMYSDYTFGNLALRSKRVGSAHLIVDPELRRRAMLLTYHVKYRHELGNPYSA